MKTIILQWRQQEDILTLNLHGDEYHLVMPEGWSIEKTHPDLFFLSEFLLLFPGEPSLLDHVMSRNWSRVKGCTPGLLFSAGLDSTAAKLLMPDKTQCMYFQADWEHQTQLNQENQLRSITQLQGRGENPIVIRGDIDRIRIRYFGGRGFSYHEAVGVPLILMGDMLNLGSISTGMSIEETYLTYGYKYRDYEADPVRNLYASLFENAGLSLFYPLIGLSKKIIRKIVASSELSGLAFSCVRGVDGIVCGTCIKCYRNELAGGNIVESKAADIFLSRRPISFVSDILHCVGDNHLWGMIDELREYEGVDVSFLNRYYPAALELIPDDMRKDSISKMKVYTEFMSISDINKLESFDLSGGEEVFITDVEKAYHTGSITLS